MAAETTQQQRDGAGHLPAGEPQHWVIFADRGGEARPPQPVWQVLHALTGDRYSGR